jgi:hypothetical protein
LPQRLFLVVGPHGGLIVIDSVLHIVAALDIGVVTLQRVNGVRGIKANHDENREQMDNRRLINN